MVTETPQGPDPASLHGQTPGPSLAEARRLRVPAVQGGRRGTKDACRPPICTSPGTSVWTSEPPASPSCSGPGGAKSGAPCPVVEPAGERGQGVCSLVPPSPRLASALPACSLSPSLPPCLCSSACWVPSALSPGGNSATSAGPRASPPVVPAPQTPASLSSISAIFLRKPV